MRRADGKGPKADQPPAVAVRLKGQESDNRPAAFGRAQHPRLHEHIRRIGAGGKIAPVRVEFGQMRAAHHLDFHGARAYTAAPRPLEALRIVGIGKQRGKRGGCFRQRKGVSLRQAKQPLCAQPHRFAFPP